MSHVIYEIMLSRGDCEPLTPHIANVHNITALIFNNLASNVKMVKQICQYRKLAICEA